MSRLLRTLNAASFVPAIAFAQVATRLFLRIEESGPPPPRGGGFLVVANHQSYADPVVLQMALRRRIRFLMTEDFYDRPAIRWFFRWMRALRVSESRTNLASLRVARDALRDGDLVGLFPEGELSRTGRMGRARPGAAMLASLAGRPVLPVHLDGSFEVWPKGQALPRPGVVRVARGRPIPAPAGNKESRRAFTRDLMDAIAAL